MNRQDVHDFLMAGIELGLNVVVWGFILMVLLIMAEG